MAQKQLAIQKGSRQSEGQSCEKEIWTFGGETLEERETKERDDDDDDDGGDVGQQELLCRLLAMTGRHSIPPKLKPAAVCVMWVDKSSPERWFPASSFDNDQNECVHTQSVRRSPS